LFQGLPGRLIDFAVVRESAVVVGRKSDKEHVTPEIVFSLSDAARCSWLRASKHPRFRCGRAARSSAPAAAVDMGKRVFARHHPRAAPRFGCEPTKQPINIHGDRYLNGSIHLRFRSSTAICLL
jgi:hypothetical protein